MLQEDIPTEPQEIYRIRMIDKGLYITIKDVTYYSHIASLGSEVLSKIEFSKFSGVVNLTIPFPYITGTGNGVIKDNINWDKMYVLIPILGQIFEKLNESLKVATPHMYLSDNPQAMTIELKLDNKGKEIKVFLNPKICNLLRANYLGLIRLNEIEETILKTHLMLTTTAQRTVDRTLISFKQNHGAKSVTAMMNNGTPYFSVPSLGGSSVIGKLNSDNFDGFLDSRDIKSGLQTLTLLSALASFWDNRLMKLQEESGS